MKTFHNNPELKEKMIEQIKWHQEQDKIIQGTYGKDGKYCAVGCSIQSLNIIEGKDFSNSDHSVYETSLGIPEILAYLEDGLFENMSKEDSKTWPLKFIEAVPVGIDLSDVYKKFVIWEWRDETYGIKNIKEVQDDKELFDCCESVCLLYERTLAGEKVTNEEWSKLEELSDKIYGAGAGAWAGARAWAWAGAWARAGAWAWAGAWARARAGAGAWAWARAGAGAWARAGARAEFDKQIMVSAEKLLELIRETK